MEIKQSNKLQPRKTNSVTYASIDGSDQPGYQSNLCLHEESLGPQLSSKSTAQTVIRMDESLGINVRKCHIVGFALVLLKLLNRYKICNKTTLKQG